MRVRVLFVPFRVASWINPLPLLSNSRLVIIPATLEVLMRRGRSASIFVAVAACALLGLGASAQERAGRELEKAGGRARLGEGEERLVRDSRAAIVAQGISAHYFDAHFNLSKAAAAPGDRRVVWRF